MNKGSIGGRVRWSALALLVAGCGAAGTPGVTSGAMLSTPPLSLVVIVGDPGGRMGQLERVILDRATPAETVVVKLPATGPFGGTYEVRGGDSLNSIAG